MSLRSVSPDLFRNVDAAMTLLAVPFSIADHLSKKADVSALQKDLELLRAQLVAEVVGDMQSAIVPLLAERAQTGTNDGLIEPPLPVFDDATKDRVTAALRKHEPTILLINKLRRLPLQINRLNGAVFWLIVGIAASAFVGAGVLTIFNTAFHTQMLCVLIPAFFIVATIMVAIVRQGKVQYANGQILRHNS